MSLCLPKLHRIAYGAIIARALGVGIETSPCWDEAVPIGVVVSGTWASQPSSCCESLAPLLSYHEPAWEASRIAMLQTDKQCLCERLDCECSGSFSGVGVEMVGYPELLALMQV